MWKTLRKILGILTDILTLGRVQGWWSRTDGIPQDPQMRDPREAKKNGQKRT